MKQRSARPPGERWIDRRWPDLLLGLLAGTSVFVQPLTTPGAWWLGGGIWLAAAAAVAFDALFRRRDQPRGTGDRDLRALVLAVTGVHTLSVLAADMSRFSGNSAGGAPLWPVAYAMAIVVAAARLPGWAPPLSFAALAAVLELGHLTLLHRFGASPAPVRNWLDTGTALVLLCVFAVVVAAVAHRARRERAALQAVIEEHEHLRGEAEELRAVGDDYREPAPERLSPRGKTTRIMSAVVENDSALERLLSLASLSIGARSVALFLLAEDGERLRVRSSVGGEGMAIDRDAALRLGEGVIGRAARTRRPALFTNLDPESLRPGPYGEETTVPSLVIVPVSESGVFRGVLVAAATTPGAFGSEHERILEGFSGEIGNLLDNARADAGRERRGHRLEALRFVSQALTATIKIEEVLNQLVDLTRGIVPCDRCALFLADAAGTDLVLGAQRGFLPDEAEKVRIPFDYGLAGYIATHGRSLLFTDLKERNRTSAIVPDSPGQERIRSFLGLPIRHREGLVGVWILAAEDPGRFDADDLDILSVVAAQAATMISNAVLHQTVERLAVTDGLTGLFNHRRFQERLAEELERAERHHEPLSLLLLDIDHFKKVNDTYGHPFGDRVLKTLAAELGRLARRVDFVARYGGEEFAIILVNTDRRGCKASAQRVLKAVRALRIPHQGGVFTMTLSVGTATCPDNATTREELVRCADKALYAAKEGGRDRAVASAATGAAAAPGEAESGRLERVARR